MPVNPSLVDDFDPETVPTVGDLLNELNKIPSDISEGRKVEGAQLPETQELAELMVLIQDYEHTSLEPYVKIFEKHVAAILRDGRGAKRGESHVSELGFADPVIAVKEESMDF